MSEASSVALPKAVQIAREALGVKEEYSPDDIKNLPRKEKKALGTALKRSLSESQAKEYKELKTDKERHDWFAVFLSDPEAGSKRGFNRHVAYSDKGTIDDEEWILESTLAGPDWLNSAELAKILVDSKELPEQASKYKCFADKGILEYQVSKSKIRKMLGSKQEGGVEMEQKDISAEEYKAVVDSMELPSSSLTSPAPKKPRKEKEPESEESKQLKVCWKNRSSQLGKLKTTYDRILKESDEYQRNVEKLKAKGYPEQTSAFLAEQGKPLVKALECALDLWKTEAAKSKSQAVAAEQVEADTISLEQEIKAVEGAHDGIKKTHMADVKKLTVAS